MLGGLGARFDGPLAAVGRASSTLRSLREDRRFAAGFSRPDAPAFRRVDGLLRPGTWHVAHRKISTLGRRDPVALVRDGADVPLHIDGSAFTNSGHVADPDLTWRALEVGPSASQDPDFQADVWLLRWGNRWLLFDLERGEVGRWADEPYSDDYVDLRRAFERHVRSVTFRKAGDGDWLMETTVAGTNMFELAPEDQTGVRRELLRSFAGLVRHEQRPAPDDAPTRSMEALERSPISGIRSRVDDIVSTFGLDVPHVPSHGDCSGSNVIVDEVGSPTLIDFGNLGLRPFWWDAVIVAGQDRRVWASGGFDRELADIWEAAGMAPVAWTPDRVRLQRRIGRRISAALNADRRIAETRGPLRGPRRLVWAAEQRQKLQHQSSSMSQGSSPHI